MLGNINAVLDKLIEKRVTNSSWKWNRVFLWKNQQEKEDLKKHSNKCQRIWTVDRDIEVKSVDKNPNIRKI